jgi:NAD(P)-dependent dehydrogenase (short-subunit alcohol dehydrogenase family)
MVTRLSGKVALITGGGTGIGRACALLFAREGARVAVTGQRPEPLAAVVREIQATGGQALRKDGGQAFSMTCDVSKAEQVKKAVDTVVAHFGALHVLVNNAGVLHVGSVEETSEEEWDRVIDVDLKGTFLVSRAALPALRKAGGGSIVNIGSVLGLVGMKKRAAYTAAKGGVTLLTKAMALDHAQEKIRVNCICPAIVETELVQRILARAPDVQAARRMREEQLPVGRLGQPEDVAALALFLASEESSWLTGAAIPLDGGLTAY